MSRVVKKGRTVATPDLGSFRPCGGAGTVWPARWYWYQFKAGAHVSVVGRTRTAPDARKSLDKLCVRLRILSALRSRLLHRLRAYGQEDLDLVIHLGDYIYEGRLASARRPEARRA